MQLVNIGYDNYVNAARVISVVSPESQPVKRLIQNAKETGRVIDVTQGRKTMSVILTDSEHIILSYLKCDTLAEKFGEPDKVVPDAGE